MKFFMDYDNMPGKGPLMLFKDNGDGTASLATVEDVATAIQSEVDAAFFSPLVVYELPYTVSFNTEIKVMSNSPTQRLKESI